MSHTVTTKIEFRDKGPLGDAIVKMGGKVLGQGSHKLFAGFEGGFGFELPGWRFPLVLTDKNELKFDDYNGAWGKQADLETLKGYYAVEMAAKVAADLMWQTERIDNGITVFHPQGGYITVTHDGTVDANGMVGKGCTAAVEAFSTALGTQTGSYCKREALQTIQENVVIES